MKKIIVNNLFVGSFGFDESNIPIEVINFYQADNAKENKSDVNNCYVYLAPRGQLGVDDENEVEAILFVRTAFTGVVEVIGKTGKIVESYVKNLQYENQGEKKVKNMPEEQKKAITSIKYGGYTLEQIFSRNGAGENVYVSCKVEDLYVPTKTFFIAMSQEYANKAMLSPENCIVMSKEEETKNDNKEVIKKINNQSMKVIYNDIEMPEQYNRLNEIINDGNLWRKLSEKDQYENSKDKVVEDDNIFKAIRRQDDEVVFSSMLYYFLSKYKETVLPKFVQDVLGITTIQISNETLVQREKHRMDISIITDEMFIIIENKIKSGINGVSDCLAETGKIKSQLSKYYQKAEDENSRLKKSREIKCYILHPEYSHLDLNNFEKGNEYCEISYKMVHEFFGKIIDDNEKNKILDDTDSYYAEQFYKALYKHTTKTDCSHRNELLKRLKRRISKLSESKPHEKLI